MAAYYNEWNSHSAEWLRNLISAGYLPAGDVDQRSIMEVKPDDIRGYTQAHFFAGIGGWSHALRLANWPDERPVWTGSCPCQPFSVTGSRKAQNDDRHLWPIWFRLIAECRPASVFGEQVAGAITHGWLDEVASNLEAIDYAFGSAVLPAYSVKAHHIRERIFFGANAQCAGLPEGFQQRWWAKLCEQVDLQGFEHTEFSSWDSAPELPLLVYGLSSKVDEPATEGFGNAIVPQVGAAFIHAFEGCRA